MTKKIHIVAGVSTIILTAVPVMSYVAERTTPSASTVLCGVIGGYIGSFVPDLDYPKHLARRSNRSLTPHERNLKFNHRGWLHTLIIPLILFVINLSMRFGNENWLTSPVAGLLGLVDGIIIGYIVHLFADMFTPKGVKIGFPIYHKPISFANIRFLQVFNRSHFLWLIVYVFVLFIFLTIYYSIFLY